MGVTYAMTCPQCNADLLDSTAFCPRCGTSIRPATFSYLPPGAPPWPADVPRMPYRAGSTAESTREDANLSAAKISSRPRRPVSSILLIIALLILVPLVGVGATLGILWANGNFSANPTTHVTVQVPLPTPQTPAASSSPTATTGQLPTPTSFQTISSTSGNTLGIAMKYPGNWVETPTTQPTQYGLVSADFHPQQQIGIDLTIKRIPSKSLTGATIQDVNQANVDSFGTDQNVKNLHTITTTTTQQTVGGVQWTQQDAGFTDPNSLPYHFTVLSVLHNQYYYSFTFYAPNNNYDEAMQKYFQPILSSFQFQS